MTHFLLDLCYLFFIGAVFGWVLELFFRRFLSRANPERKWINPGFCVGPWLPLYGFGLCLLYLFSRLGTGLHAGDSHAGLLLLILLMGLGMTVIEYLAGLLCVYGYHLRLWDYSDKWGNLQGIICPQFSLYWTILGAVYFLFVHPVADRALSWLAEHQAFYFVMGFFWGVFTIDVIYSGKIVSKLRQFARDNDVLVRYELLKAHIRSQRERAKEKAHFLFSFRTERPLTEYLWEHLRDARHSAQSVLEQWNQKHRK